MPFVEIGLDDDDSVDLYLEDYGSGQPVILIHGWPLSHKMWEPQIETIVEAGYRCIAYDRRGFGESSKPWSGYDYDTMAEDLQSIIEALELDEVILVGFSMGGGEVARYIGNYGTDSIAKAVLISAVTPYMLQSDDNPEGVPEAQFDEMVEGLTNDRLAFLDGFVKKFVGDGLLTHPVSADMLHYQKMIAAFAAPHATRACVHAFGTTDFRDDLAAFDIPTLIVHGDADDICPLKTSGQKSSQMIANSRLEVIEGAPHGLNLTHREELNELLLDFFQNG